MKKNMFLRVASVLLVLTLLSTCAISGTFAKYVTADTAADVARVAKFGVTITAWDNTNFSTTYAADDNTTGVPANTVVSSTSETLVAPGTKNETGVSFSIKLQDNKDPEVAVKLDVVMANAGGNIVDVVLPASPAEGYTDPTTGDVNAAKFTQTDAYYPVKYTLTKDGTQVKQGNLAAIETYLENLSGYYMANTEKALSSVAGTYTLTWAWDFETNNDKADTMLGNIASGLTTVDGASTDIKFDIAITVTQVD